MWCTIYPQDREYTHYSHVQDLHLVLQSDHLVGTLLRAVHMARVISNHAPVMLEFQWWHARPRILTWMLNVEALKDKVFCKTIRQLITQYFDINNNTVADMC